MTRVNLADHVRYCEVAGRHIFLDLVADRYFALPPHHEAGFPAIEQGNYDDAGARELLDILRAAGLVVTADEGSPMAPTRHALPSSSLIEGSSQTGAPGIGTLVEIFVTLRACSRAVARRKLPTLLASLVGQPTAGGAASLRDGLVLRFLAARAFVPLGPNCLTDSLALLRYLQRRDLRPSLIIGVKLQPFGAHCWLQDGSVILNDTLAAACGFTPILVA